jgi:3-(3-hydroxy-phenyl)propionate hydroxylase
LTNGFFEQSKGHAHSELLPQPLMERRDGSVLRLDALLGDGFSVIGHDTPAFRAHAQGLLPPGMPGVALALVKRDDDFMRGHTGIETVRDMSGVIAALLDSYRAAAIVLRPDRYGYRLVDAAQLSESPQRNMHEAHQL